MYFTKNCNFLVIIADALLTSDIFHFFVTLIHVKTAFSLYEFPFCLLICLGFFPVEFFACPSVDYGINLLALKGLDFWGVSSADLVYCCRQQNKAAETFLLILETIRVIISLNSRYYCRYCWIPIEKVPAGHFATIEIYR